MRKLIFEALLTAGHVLINWAPKVYPEGRQDWDEIDWKAEAEAFAEDGDEGFFPGVVFRDGHHRTTHDTPRTSTNGSVTWAVPLHWGNDG
jgi:hypothetical protein